MASEKPQLSEKAVRYIDALSEARCEGKWSEVSELARKVEKHSGRKCLVQAARTQVSQEQRIASKAPGPPNVPIEPLLATVPDPSGTKEDQYQGRVCVQWLHWIEGKYDQAILAVPPEIIPPIDTEKAAKLSGWTHVCMIQSAFIRGACYEAIGKRKEAVIAYRDAASRVLGPSSVSVKETAQYKFWTERLLNRFSRISEPEAEANNASGDQVLDALEVFRAWSRASQKDTATSGITIGGLSLEEKLTRRSTWLSYYRFLSSIVSKLSGGPGHLSLKFGDISIPSKLELYNEVRHVETAYERILLREVEFPRADEYNPEVEEWVGQAMLNWSVFAGPAWTVNDVPKTGKRGVSRSMLDILYRAATKTFHSMSILRSLCTVHASLGEFDLAARAFDSYVTLATRAKARIQKSGEAESGVDNDNTIANAMSAGIEMLCTAGDRKEAERAQELSLLLARLADDLERPLSSSDQKPPAPNEQEKTAQDLVRLSISSETLSHARRAIGISNARWAQLTYDVHKRSDLHATSNRYLRKSLQGGPANEVNLEALYSLGLACAQSRDTQSALASVKQALLETLPSDESIFPPKKLSEIKSAQMFAASTRCWHLLTLLLTSRQDYENAAAACDEALNQYSDKNRSEIFARMSLGDKENLLSLRISRLAIKQVLESTEAAINESTSLISLHSELFPERPRQAVKTGANAATLNAPSVISGSQAFSIRGSVLGKAKSNRSSQNVGGTEASKIVSGASDATSQHPPTFDATEEEGEPNRPTTSHSQKGVSRGGSKRLQKRSSRKSMSKQAKPVIATDTGTTVTSVENVNKGATSSGAPQIGTKILPSELSPTGNVNVDGIIDKASISTFVPCPAVHYSEGEYARRSSEMLAGIWLFISSLYRQAGLFVDSADSLHEAYELVRDIEAEVAKDAGSSAEQFERPGWGFCKSVDELWANIYTERGQLRLAQQRPLAALAEFENSLAHFPDHVTATVGLANILLDIYAGKVVIPTRGAQAPISTTIRKADEEAEEPSRPILATVPDPSMIGGDFDLVDGGGDGGGGLDSSTSASITHRHMALYQDTDEHGHEPHETLRNRDSVSRSDLGSRSDSGPHSPESLDRLAARDRAYSLLSALSKLGTGWDRSEVWFALSRAYEESGQLDRAQEALWWVVELEKKRPIRGWGSVGRGFSLWF